MSDEVKPHYKDFFLYILIILVAFLVVIFLFSKNYTETTANKVDNTAVTSSATPKVTQPASQK